MDFDTLRPFITIALIWMGVSLVLAILLFILVIRKLGRLNIPANAGFAETLLYTPFLVVLFIDLLDWGLDILAAPFSWLVLDRLGLKALRNAAALEALIPFTQPIPTLTLAWFWVRLFGPDRLPPLPLDANPPPDSHPRRR
ncbi:MAG: hypothetical protein RRC07_10865 [Anaerolineae bacterium]|nr:hypothetical protein [Anaerolineae bacterium]